MVSIVACLAFLTLTFFLLFRSFLSKPVEMGASASQSSPERANYQESSRNQAIASLFARLFGPTTIPFDDVFWDILVDTLEQHASTLAITELTPLVDDAAVRFGKS